MKLTKNRHKHVADDIYDLIRGTAIANKKPANFTEWDELTKKHHEEATKSMRKFFMQKDIELQHFPDKNMSTIRIGKHITITIQ